MGLLAWVAWRLLGTDSIGRDGDYLVIRNDIDDETKRELTDELELPAYENPVKGLHELEDSQEAIYVWEVPEEPNRNALMRAFEQNNVGDMQALHIVLTDKEELTQFGPDDLRPYVDASIGGNE